MKYNSILLAGAVATFALASCGNEASTDGAAAVNPKEQAEDPNKQKQVDGIVDNGEYHINTTKSHVGWNATKVSGEHFGSVSVEKGTVNVKAGMVADAQVFINMQSITVEDMEGEYADKLLGHLKSEDFFNVEAFPGAFFNLSGIKYVDNQYIASGSLKILDTEGPISFPVKLTNVEGALQIEGTATVDRTAYGIKYGSGKFFEDLGDKMIHDEFTLKFNIYAEPV